jgi:Cyclic nucleotide-binding domain
MARSAAVDRSRIESFPVLADLPGAELDELAAALGELEVDAKVITRDDYGTAIYFIEQGEADVLADGDEAAEAVGPGDAVGEIGLLLTGQRTATGLEFPVEWADQGVPPEQILEGLRPLLELPVEHVLATHGGPADRAALERALA